MKSRQITPFGREIKKALVDKEMTQRQLAALVGVSEAYLGLILYGERRGNKYKQKIIAALGLDPTQVEQQSA